jgi:hypothetical protein
MYHTPYEIGERKMFIVKFFENRNLLLTQLLKVVPTVGEDVTIKGKKGKISSVSNEDESTINVQLFIEKVSKSKLVAVDNSKKKKR